MHHFVVVVTEEAGGVVNVIPHKYLIEPDGSVGADNFWGLTKEERADLSRLMVAKEFEVGDRERLNEIHAKAGPGLDVPREAIGPLKWALNRGPVIGSAAERFFARYR